MSPRTKSIITAIVCLANLGWWLAPGNVDYLIAQNRDIFLGRYSEGRFYAMFFTLLLSAPLLYILRAAQGKRRERFFVVISVTLGLVAGLALLDTGVRLVRTPRYVKTGDVYHRPPNRVITSVFKDAPTKAHSYSGGQPGHPDVPYTLTTDKRGFRNRTDQEAYDLVALGDSFTEGSKVSDDEAWLEIVAEKTGASVYNLGVSGSGPSSYVQSMQMFGKTLSPKMVICMIYEGNDFRGSGELVDRLGQKASFGVRMQVYFKNSPVRLAIDRFITEKLTRSAAPRALHLPSLLSPAPAWAAKTDLPGPLDWLPIRAPASEQGHYYTFTVKRLIEHYRNQADFAATPGCITARKAIVELKAICQELGAELVIGYAPDKARVVMHLMREEVSAEQITSFLSLKKKNLPDPAATKATLYANLDAREKEVKRICEQEGVKFISPTRELIQAMKEGGQTYYTYDQHWSPLGHKVVAQKIIEALSM